MTDVDKVALWTGLIGSVVGIVLSIVAIVLSFVSNNRAEKVNDQAIKSLQKIESDVERVSDDTRTLIKAGWDKMLENFYGEQQDGHLDEEADESAEEPDIAKINEPNIGKLDESNQNVGDARLIRLEAEIESLKKSLATRQRISPRNSANSSVDVLLRKLEILSPAAQAVFEILSRSGHLTQKQLDWLLTSGLIGTDITELLRLRLIVPLKGIENGTETIVYWLSGRYARAANVATQLAQPVPSSVVALVTDQLRKSGYKIK